MSKFLLTIRVPIEAIDVVQARQKAIEICEHGNRLPHRDSQRSVKLQRVFDDKPPESFEAPAVLKV